MAGVFTDNQPDFSFLAPYETRTFEQYWYPIRAIGPAVAANREAALSLRMRAAGSPRRRGRDSPHPCSPGPARGPGGAILDRTVELAPDATFVTEIELAGKVPATTLSLAIEAADGRPILGYHPAPALTRPVPPSATEPPQPAEIGRSTSCG